VKEHAEKWNRMSASDLKMAMPTTPTSPINPNIPKETAAQAKPGLSPRISQLKDDDTDSSSVQGPLDPLKKDWMLASALCNKDDMIELLKEDCSLVNFKDITSGYTALHWASKFGELDIVVLLIRGYRANPNIRAQGGYTPLHVAFMFCRCHGSCGHEPVQEYLLQNYADPNIRDFSGKLPYHYSKKFKQRNSQNSNGAPEADVKHSKQHRHQFGPSGSQKLSTKNLGESSSLSHSAFIRIGSLNTKMMKTAKAITGMTKTWGSSEAVDDTFMMPPPSSKLQSKMKKKGNKHARGQSISGGKDSDSDYGFH